MARVPSRRSLDDPPADKREVSEDAARSEIVRHGPQQQSRSSRKSDRFPLFTVSRDSTPLTLDRVKQHENEH